MEHPEIVYKYRDWNEPYHQKILTENQLYLSSPGEFNDPFDCRIAPNMALLLKSEGDLEFYANRIANANKPRIEADGIDFEDFKNSIKNSLRNKLSSSQSEYEDMYYKSQDMNYGVLSMGGRWNSILMWSHYANKHQGFCVGFDTQKMNDSRFFGSGGPVHYNTEYPDIHPNDKSPISMFTETHTKSEEWIYEDEYRYIQMIQGRSIEERLVTIPDNFYRELILGINCPIDHRDSLIKLAQEKSIPVYQAHKVERRFEIGRELVG